MTDQFLSYVQKWGLGSTVNVTDYSDKFHYLLMTILLIVFATLTTIKQYVLQPMVCELASKPSGVNFADYVTNLCWVEGTYYVIDPDKSQLNFTDAYWDRQPKATYYQWVPFTLGIQAAMFYMPRLLWLAYVHNREGPDLEALLERASEANKATDWKLRRGLIDCISRNIDRMLMLRRGASEFSYVSKRRAWRRFFAMRPRGCLPGMYAVVKLLFLINATLQMYLMGMQLAPEGRLLSPFLFGFHLIGVLRSGYDWRASRIFPRITVCRVKLQHLGGINTYTAQCALPLNMLNEKIYCVLWVSSAFGACLTCLSMVQWTMRLVCGRGRWRHHLRRYLLQMRGCVLLQEGQLVREFADHLHTEGVFLVHMIRLNVGEIVACDVTNCLYEQWRERHRASVAEAETRFSLGGVLDSAEDATERQCPERQSPEKGGPPQYPSM